jgi:ATP-dependent Clp endopeptidase proteolytic subunit ClpP
MYELRAKSKKEIDILMYGSIGEWNRVNAEDTYRALTSAKNQGYEKVNLKINSPGGQIFEGIAILTQMNIPGIEIHATVEGFAASMGSVILQGATRRKMVRGGRLMIHQGSGGVIGSANQIRNYADLLDSLNKTLADIYAKRTGKDSKWILDNWMAEGKDTWFTAEQALKENLIDEITEGNVKPLEKEQASYMEMAAHYSQQFETENAMTKETKDKLIKELNLKADATDEQILEAIEVIKKPDAPAADPAKPAAPAAAESAATEKAALVEGIVALAKERGVTDEKQLAALKKVAEMDIKAAMDLMPAAAKPAEKSLNLNELIASFKNEGGAAATNTDRSKWNYEQWEKNDPKGLLALANTKPDEFAALFEASFGYKPTEEEIKKTVTLNA